MVLFPNPAADQFFFVINREVKGPLLLNIFDITGRRVGNFSSLQSGGKIDGIELGLSPGVYQVVVNNGHETFSSRLVFQ
jgi:hypothetical protein